MTVRRFIRISSGLLKERFLRSLTPLRGLQTLLVPHFWYRMPVIIPIQPSPLDLWATSDTLKLAEEAKGFNQKLKIGIAINREIGNTEISKAVEKELHKTGIEVFHNHIKQRVAFAEVMAEGKTVMEIKDPHDKANAEF